MPPSVPPSNTHGELNLELEHAPPPPDIATNAPEDRADDETDALREDEERTLEAREFGCDRVNDQAGKLLRWRGRALRH